MKYILSMIISVHLLFAAYIRDDAKETVYDDQTGLIWQDDAVGSTMTWQAAIGYCEGLDFADAQDWRLPNINELLSITDMNRNGYGIDAAFQHYVSTYWSSTSLAPDPEKAWYVLFDKGYGYWYSKNYPFYVRCVRGGQNSSSSALSPALILYLLN